MCRPIAVCSGIVFRKSVSTVIARTGAKSIANSVESHEIRTPLSEWTNIEPLLDWHPIWWTPNRPRGNWGRVRLATPRPNFRTHPPPIVVILNQWARGPSNLQNPFQFEALEYRFQALALHVNWWWFAFSRKLIVYVINCNSSYYRWKIKTTRYIKCIWLSIAS